MERVVFLYGEGHLTAAQQRSVPFLVVLSPINSLEVVITRLKNVPWYDGLVSKLCWDLQTFCHESTNFWLGFPTVT